MAYDNICFLLFLFEDYSISLGKQQLYQFERDKEFAPHAQSHLLYPYMFREDLKQ